MAQDATRGPAGAAEVGPEASPGRLRRVLSRFTTTSQELHDRELREEHRASGATPIGESQVGERTTVAGTVRSMMLRPRGGVPALEAELYDGSGSVTLIFLGRRQIQGIDCGRRMTASGRVTSVAGRPVIFNPSYELRP
jgi:RecG-like helicase